MLCFMLWKVIYMCEYILRHIKYHSYTPHQSWICLVTRHFYLSCATLFNFPVLWQFIKSVNLSYPLPLRPISPSTFTSIIDFGNYSFSSVTNVFCFSLFPNFWILIYIYSSFAIFSFQPIISMPQLYFKPFPDNYFLRS